MNGAPLRRLAATFDDLRLGARLVTDEDKEWLRIGARNAETQGRLTFWEAELQRLSGAGSELFFLQGGYHDEI